MKPFKIAAIFLIIGAGIIGSYLIVKNPATSSSSGQTLSVSNQDFTKNPIKWIEDAAKSVTDSANGLADIGNSLIKNNGNSDTENKDAVNLTELAAQAIFNRMKNLDEAGQNPFEGQSFNPDDPQSQKLIEETLSGIQSSNPFIPKLIKNEDIKILNDNSQKMKSEYLNAIESISQNRLNKYEYRRTAEQVMEDLNNDCFSPQTDSVNFKLAASYSAVAEDYLGIYVPSDWVELHKQIINYFKKGSLIYSAIGKCYEDPISESLAVQELSQFLSESQIIQDLLVKKTAEAGL